MLNPPAVVGHFKVVGRNRGYAAVVGTHLYLAGNEVCLGNYPGFFLVVDMGAWLRYTADLLAVKVMLIGQTAQ